MTPEKTSNNFDFMRFCAATLVIFSHCYPLLGQRDFFAILTGADTAGWLAVSTFFIISGYLITGSYLQSSSVGSYLVKRILRIYPALIVSVLFCAFILGVAVTTASLAHYFSSDLFSKFLQSTSLFIQYYRLPGVFEQNPVPYFVNGQNWTLPIEFICYFMLILAAKSSLLQRQRLLYLVAALYMLHLWVPVKHVLLPGILTYYLIGYMALFFAGSLLHLYKDTIPRHTGIFLLLIGINIASFHRPECYFIMCVSLPYMVIYLARTPVKWMQNFGKYGDFSYGLYLYGYPMQQLVIYVLGDAISVPVLFGYSFALALPLSIFSWKLVEAPSLQLKNVFFRANSKSTLAKTEKICILSNP